MQAHDSEAHQQRFLDLAVGCRVQNPRSLIPPAVPGPCSCELVHDNGMVECTKGAPVPAATIASATLTNKLAEKALGFDIWEGGGTWVRGVGGEGTFRNAR